MILLDMSADQLVTQVCELIAMITTGDMQLVDETGSPTSIMLNAIFEYHPDERAMLEYHASEAIKLLKTAVLRFEGVSSDTLS